MPQQLRDSAGAPIIVPERSTLPIQLTFRDGGEAGPLVTPTSVTWSLVDTSGNVINSRSNQALTPSAGTGLVVLAGADLANLGDGEIERRLTVRAVYDSATYGEDLPLTEEFSFRIAPLAGVPAGG